MMATQNTWLPTALFGGFNDIAGIVEAPLNLVIKPITESESMFDRTFSKLRSIPEIKMVSYNGTATTIHWVDGTKTSVRCGQGESFDKYTGFMAAVCKKLFGSTTAAKKIRSRVDVESLKAAAVAEHAEKEAIAQQKREKREKAIVKRRAKELVIEMRAKKLANEMLNLVHE